MNPLALNKTRNNHNSTCGDLIAMGEQELAAFFNAVTELFGSEQAELSAQEWLHELVAANDLLTSTRDWRRITVKVSARLASRVSASSVSTPFPTLAYTG
jgi:hypothetical protein